MDIGPFPRLDDPDDIRWGLLGNAFIRGLVTWVTGRDPVAERYHEKMAKESLENAARFAPLEKQLYEELRQANRRHSDGSGHLPGHSAGSGHVDEDRGTTD